MMELFFPMFSASSMVSGSFLPSVSGSIQAKTPEIKATIPNSRRGRNSNTILSRGTKGAKRAPNLENVEKVPTPPLLINVGNISAIK